MLKPKLCDKGEEFYSGAEFSPCRHYRYALWRRWRGTVNAEQVMFIGLNPSTADETEDDNTIRRCIRFAKDWGYCGIVMTNAYGFRATLPKCMKEGKHTPDSLSITDDPIGPRNTEVLIEQSKNVGLIIAAWGVHCEPAREQGVCSAIGLPIHCLGKTKDGRPRHPLYLKADTKPRLFWRP